MVAQDPSTAMAIFRRVGDMVIWLLQSVNRLSDLAGMRGVSSAWRLSITAGVFERDQ
jgi:hypothetical protein